MLDNNQIAELQIAKKLDGRLSSFIVPCKNEEEVLPHFYSEFLKVIELMGSPNYELIFVEDGSSDNTMQILKKFAEENSQVRFISFTRNFGKEAAMLAGLKAASGEFVAILDADLQDPPNLLPEMYQGILDEDFDSVATRRADREGESKVRSFLANSYYAVINKFSSVKLVSGARDFRLMTRKMVDAILSLPENTRFTKGIYEWVGFKTKWLSFENHTRRAGKTKWSVFQLFLYGLDGLTAFSTVPLAIASIMGLALCALSSVAITLIVLRKLIYADSSIWGWPSMMCTIIFLGGLQLMFLGLIGQYLAKSYMETKRRPIYIIKEKK